MTVLDKQTFHEYTDQELIQEYSQALENIDYVTSLYSMMKYAQSLLESTNDVEKVESYLTQANVISDYDMIQKPLQNYIDEKVMILGNDVHELNKMLRVIQSEWTCRSY